jgi:hypothetical protein
MILYNVTISIDSSISEEWLSWMRTHHIPDVLATNCFIECRLSKIHGEEEGGLSFSIMYLCSSQAILEDYQLKYAPKLQAEHSKRFDGKFAAFRTYLTVLEEFRL